ncbi:hypothetical protein [Albibacterium profundi]|uniref:Uncharacterized protein n=1 Tax=Albibacterium profundi TaxID=3134906 RepID=A0ABV5CJE9_9SPHI
MKSKITILLLLCSLMSFGQSRELLNEISIDVGKELEGSELRGSRYWFYFKKNQENEIKRTNEFRFPEHLNPTIISLLEKYADSLVMDEVYRLSVYHDVYSSKVYAYADTVFSHDGVFVNSNNYLSRPKIGLGQFQDKLHDELRSHQQEVDTFSLSDWRKPIFILVEPFDEKHQVITENKLVKYLDSSLNVPWKKPIYHANPINAIAEIRLRKGFLSIDKLNPVYRYHDFVRFYFALRQQYKNTWVGFVDREIDLPDNPELMVSVIFNPLTLKVENPVIHNSDPEKAMLLIDWIEKLNLSERMFYWRYMAEAKRTYYFTVTP